MARITYHVGADASLDAGRHHLLSCPCSCRCFCCHFGSFEVLLNGCLKIWQVLLLPPFVHVARSGF